MKTFLTIFFLLFAAAPAFAQWPGYFYLFQLEDESGRLVDAANKDYKMTPVKAREDSDILLSVKACDDGKSWRYSEGGYHGLDETNRLRIERSGDKPQTMTIDFPTSLSKGKHPYYGDLWVGKLKFQEGTYVVKLPETPGQWDHLQEKKLCPIPGIERTYRDVSGFQRQGT